MTDNPDWIEQIVRQRCAAKDAEIVRLREALEGVLPFVSGHEVSEPWKSKLEAAMEEARAALKGSPAPCPTCGGIDLSQCLTVGCPDVPAEGMRAKCEAIAREASEEHDGFGYEPNALRIADAIAALKGKRRGVVSGEKDFSSSTYLGMTLRAWLVGQILPGLVSQVASPTDEVDMTFCPSVADVVGLALRYADEAIRQLEAPK